MRNKTLWLFVGCCAVPVIAALLALNLGWLPKGTTNHGRFVEGEIHIEELKHQNGKLWTIVLNSPASCLEICQVQQSSLEALSVALGKMQKDVDIALLGEAQEGSSFPAFAGQPKLAPAHLYLVDNKGLVVLEYPYEAEPQKNRMVQKGLLQDLKKLLNFARSS